MLWNEPRVVFSSLTGPLPREAQGVSQLLSKDWGRAFKGQKARAVGQAEAQNQPFRLSPRALFPRAGRFSSLPTCPCLLPQTMSPEEHGSAMHGAWAG